MAETTHYKTRMVLIPGEQYRSKVTVPQIPGVSLIYEVNGKQVFELGPGDSIEIIVDTETPSAPAVALPAPMPPPLPPSTAAIEQPRRQMPPVIEEPATADLN